MIDTADPIWERFWDKTMRPMREYLLIVAFLAYLFWILPLAFVEW